MQKIIAMGLKPGAFETSEKRRLCAIPLLRGAEGCVIQAAGNARHSQPVVICLKHGDTPLAPFKSRAVAF